MKILLDECLPRDLKLHFPEHECRTVQEMGWSDKKNGILAGMAEGHFDVLLTVDQRFNYQVKPKSTLIVFILSAKTNKIEDLKLVPAIHEALLSLRLPSETSLVRIPEEKRGA